MHYQMEMEMETDSDFNKSSYVIKTNIDITNKHLKIVDNE